MRLFAILFFLAAFLGSTSFQKKTTPPPKKKPSATIAADTLDTPFILPKKIEWLEVVAQKKDKIGDLLKRFHLSDFECNKAKFLAINQLTAGIKILPGKIYKLPIAILKYNGKSIRTTMKIEDLYLAKRIQEFNSRAKTEKLRDDVFIISKKLWVPWHEFACPEEVDDDETAIEKIVKSGRPLPEIGGEKAYLGARVFPLFGKKYEKTPLASQKLKGKIFYIISGHGGPDVGAQGKRGKHTMCEDEYAYDVALRLTRILISHGATAYMIVRDMTDGIRDEENLQCDKDEYVWGNLTIPRPQKKRLFQRTDLVNALVERHLQKGQKNQTLIEIHVDSRSKQARTDVFFYFRENSQSSEKLAKSFHKHFYEKYLKVRAQRKFTGTVTPRDLHTLRETIVPTAVYIELGNIRNDYDQQRLVLSKNRQAVANWLGEALVEK